MNLKTVLFVFSLFLALSYGIVTCSCLVSYHTTTPMEKVKVSVYYESLCPDSIRFIKNQLFPAYKKLNSIMKVDLVPYGKATQNLVNGTWEFDCQHGKNECFGNKVQACALHQNYSEAIEVSFINCVMSQRNPATAGESCAKQVNGVTWSDINSCVFSDKGDEYLAAYGDRTHGVDPQIAFVPTVIFNDKYDDDLMWDALRNLQSVICKINPDPSVCVAKKSLKP